MSNSINRAARILRAGGIIAYPTEGVFGLGCLPGCAEAVAGILQMKGRGPEKGLLLIAAKAHQLEPWAEMPGDSSIPAPSLHKPISWVVPATGDVPSWLTGGRGTIAVRLTNFPVAANLCDAVDSALVSTSANVSGCPPARNIYVLRRQFSSLVDYIVPGRCGPVKGPSEIRDLQSGETLRPASI